VLKVFFVYFLAFGSFSQPGQSSNLERSCSSLGQRISKEWLLKL